MRLLKLLALGGIAWVAYSVITAGPLQVVDPFDEDDDLDEPTNGRPSRLAPANGSRLVTSTRLRVRWRVRVPENTPANATVYVTGNHPDLGNWSPLGLRLQSDGPRQYCGEFEFALGTTFEYKFTRGSWEAVETLRGGVPRPNRALAVRATEVVLAEVEAWSDRT